MSNKIILSPNTKITDLFNAYPTLKNELININPKFKMLKTPLAKIMLKKATLSMACEKTGMSYEQLVEKLNDIIEKIEIQ